MEGAICRPQYFDKIAAWGGERAITGIKKYAGPGLELITFDFKTSISLIGHEVFESAETLEEAAELAEIDVSNFDQSACVCSRFIFIEGSVNDVDRFCAALHGNMLKEGAIPLPSARRSPPRCARRSRLSRCLSRTIAFGVGMTVRELWCVPTNQWNFIPTARSSTSSAWPGSLTPCATSTAGVYPFVRKVELRDRLANAGAQRIVNLGMAMSFGTGAPHNGFDAMQRYMKWISDEGEL